GTAGNRTDLDTPRGGEAAENLSSVRERLGVFMSHNPFGEDGSGFGIKIVFLQNGKQSLYLVLFIKTFQSNADTISSMVVQVKSGISNGMLNDTEMAAALASASIVFKDDINYAEKLVHGANVIYNFALSMKSTPKDSDDLILGATWLYYATGDLYNI
ncbi:unnamed protein product, partial [Arabis nemorensis]